MLMNDLPAAVALALEGLKMDQENFSRLQVVRENLMRHWADMP